MPPTVGINTLSAGDRIIISIDMRGGPAFNATAARASRAVRGIGTSAKLTSAELATTTQRTWLMNQSLFTLRRFAFYGTLAIAGMAAGVLRLGIDFYNTLQTARVGFTTMLGSLGAANRELKQLYILAALTPFEFPDIVMASRRILAFNHNVGQTNALITGLLNSLSVAGLISARYLDRAALALGHMFSQGRVTGRLLYQLNQDNIPLLKALEAQYHATGEEIRDSVTRGLISAQDAAQALIKYTQSGAYRNAAKNQATKTLIGAWSTFMDFVRMGAASGTGGPLDGLRKNLKGIVDILTPLARRRDLTFRDLINAIDKQLTPKTHAVIAVFQLLSGVLTGVVGTFFVLFKIITTLLRPLDHLDNLIDRNRIAAKILGIYVGILIGLWLFAKGAILGVAFATELWNIVTLTAIRRNQLNIAVTISAIFWNTVAALSYLRMAAAIGLATLALMGLDLVMLGWIGLAIAIIGALVILYLKWKPFHDLVNNTAKFLWQNWKWVALFLVIMTGPIAATIIIVGFLVKYWGQVSDAIKSAVGWLGKFWGIMKKVGHPFAAAGRFIGHAAGAVPHATGGMVAGGLALVGERGPEVVQLPGGTRITPSYAVNPVSLGAGGAGTFSDRPIVVQLMVDRQVLASAVARANQDYAARR